ncbi:MULTISPECIES: ACP phosphodiesterase [Cedecea]|uniref:Acyl carrier protein phosphodiesterase n=1 Tax=Cedecea davisae DSM 4568 TaxID=566551 RepID=S3J317_9ENTR|nr:MULTISPECIES: ACP phosphodiesterase [Cedecea]EPF19086.1 [acyl-carrier-protein] phosphodiesterase [Cedecea davisae DSM 4568]QIX94906.1 ACP phosphodiesterase [Cedecea sp. FDAARGOS_727]SUX29237.1 acyl carrier protein phosphodiesterase [Cedecea davisae]
MNFLAHLHLAHLARSSLLGNLLADFVRGNPDDSFSPEIVAGIYMHRRVDALTDGLPEVAVARAWFSAETRRVSPISLDVMWDHFLSRHWATVCPDIGLEDFVAYARGQIEPHISDTPPRFINLNNYLWRERWLERYQDMEFIADVLNGMASRRPKLDALRASWQDLDKHYDALEQLFWQFYPRMITMAQQKSL